MIKVRREGAKEGNRNITKVCYICAWKYHNETQGLVQLMYPSKENWKQKISIFPSETVWLQHFSTRYQIETRVLLVGNCKDFRSRGEMSEENQEESRPWCSRRASLESIPFPSGFKEPLEWWNCRRSLHWLKRTLTQCRWYVEEINLEESENG